eukprot:TRINITY_DN11196_c0_g3_i1.p1 TRINITY_DN11196_c0_g3~~TRINITY_DN11196_c0_g3_i1.p1  ORF type:complete len:592 (+),score=45.47 TRINITY_DN11196_c0_g3_i1:61-1776(+)
MDRMRITTKSSKPFFQNQFNKVKSICRANRLISYHTRRLSVRSYKASANPDFTFEQQETSNSYINDEISKQESSTSLATADNDTGIEEVLVVEKEQSASVEETPMTKQRLMDIFKLNQGPESVRNLLIEYRELLDCILISSAAMSLRGFVKPYAEDKRKNKAAPLIRAYEELVKVMNGSDLETFDNKGIVNCAGSLAKAMKVAQMENHVKDLKPTLDRFISLATQRKDRINPKELASILFTLSQMDFRDTDVYTLMEAVRNLHPSQLTHYDIPQLTAAFAHYKWTNIQDIEFLAYSTKRCSNKIIFFDIPNIVANFATLRYFDQELLLSIENMILSGEKVLTRGHGIRYLFAMMDFQFSNQQQVIKMILNQINEGDFRSIQIVVLVQYVYACAYWGVPVSSLNQNMLIKVKNSKRIWKSSSMYLRLAQLLYKSMGEKLVLSGRNQKLSVSAFNEHNEAQKDANRQLKSEVFKLISGVYSQANVNYIDDKSGLCVDIAVNIDNCKIAVIVIGSDKVMLNHPKMLVSVIKVTLRLLEHAGWKIVRVFQHDWENDTSGSYKEALLYEIKTLAAS